MATDNIAVIRRFTEEVWNKGNLDALSELVADTYVANVPILGEVRGVDALRKQLQSFRTAFPDLRLTIEDIGTSGDRVFLRWTARGTHRGTLMGCAPTGNSGEIRGISIDRLSGGKIVEHQESYDSLALLQLLGRVSPLDRLPKGQPAPTEQARPR